MVLIVSILLKSYSCLACPPRAAGAVTGRAPSLEVDFPQRHAGRVGGGSCVWHLIVDIRHVELELGDRVVLQLVPDVKRAQAAILHNGERLEIDTLLLYALHGCGKHR